ncbi:nitroreductase family protein [Aquibacillus saliphilus]|uniref:nitroreductase family protein n=1 Tax=Aquibacillus saliphilus TaxID=1909422 RepID=UPI001CF01376|nr:nitroreductase family protein [Aquibacillus saliphilus]
MNKTQVSQIRKSNHQIDPIFLERWSPRSFLGKQVPEDVLMSVFEAARWAPSSSNTQPWRFILARSEDDLARFHSFIMEGNRTWCEKAPVLALIISERKSGAHAFDAGAAWGYLSLQAARNGLITHPMGGFNKDEARELLNIPEEFDIHAVVAIGYQGEKEALPKEIQEREQPSDRRPLEESIHEGTFK